MPLVIAVGEDVLDLDGAPLEPDSADERPPALADRVALELLAVFGRSPDDEGEPVPVAVPLVDERGVRAAQPRRVARDRFEDGLQLERRAPDDLQHLVRRELLVQSLGQVPCRPVDSRVRVRRWFGLGRHGRSPFSMALGGVCCAPGTRRASIHAARTCQ